MPERRYVWTPAARADSARHGVSEDEANEALAAPPGMVVEQASPDLLVVMGMAHSGRVIAVLLARIAGRQLYEVLSARPLGRPELEEWGRRVL